MAGVTVMLLTTVITPAQAFVGFSNTGVATIGVLFVVAEGIRLTNGLEYVMKYVLRNPSSLRMALVRLMFPVAIISAFLNNTPVVAMMIPVLENWGRRSNISPSKLLIPLSYAAIMGGTCTLIGTATNLVVVGLAQV